MPRKLDQMYAALARRQHQLETRVAKLKRKAKRLSRKGRELLEKRLALEGVRYHGPREKEASEASDDNPEEARTEADAGNDSQAKEWPPEQQRIQPKYT